jgi:hypothetical protein
LQPHEDEIGGTRPNQTIERALGNRIDRFADDQRQNDVDRVRDRQREKS